MIDSTLQAELRAKFNPDGSDLRRMQLRMLEMLKYVDKICRENDIKYWLSSGTCLGAVRHGGFIPWDDDCDIEMMEQDYLKLRENLMENNHSSYVFQNFKSDPDYVQRFNKLRDLNSEVKEDAQTDNWNRYKGCYIDIFIVKPSSSKKFHRICGLIWNHTIFPLANIKNNRIRRFLLKLLRATLTRTFGIFSFLQSSTCQTYRHILGSGFNKPRQFRDIKETVYVPFEDTNLPIPKGYDGYLKGIYTDYMKIPPTDEIHIHFKIIKIW